MSRFKQLLMHLGLFSLSVTAAQADVISDNMDLVRNLELTSSSGQFLCDGITFGENGVYSISVDSASVTAQINLGEYLFTKLDQDDNDGHLVGVLTINVSPTRVEDDITAKFLVTGRLLLDTTQSPALIGTHTFNINFFKDDEQLGSCNFSESWSGTLHNPPPVIELPADPSIINSLTDTVKNAVTGGKLNTKRVDGKPVPARGVRG